MPWCTFSPQPTSGPASTAPSGTWARATRISPRRRPSSVALPAPKPIFETFPIAIAAILIVHAAHLETRWTALGALVWLVARAIYLPLYALGVPVVRSLAFTASLAGLVMILWPTH